MKDFLYDLTEALLPILVALLFVANTFGATIGFVIALDRGACKYDRLWYFAAPATMVGCELGKQRDWGSK